MKLKTLSLLLIINLLLFFNSCVTEVGNPEQGIETVSVEEETSESNPKNTETIENSGNVENSENNKAGKEDITQPIQNQEGKTTVFINIFKRVSNTAQETRSDSEESKNLTYTIKDSSEFTIGTITITEAKIALSEIRLDIQQNSETASKDSLNLPGPFIIDIIKNKLSPELEHIAVQPGSCENVIIKLKKLMDSDEKDYKELLEKNEKLLNRSIVIKGKYTGLVATGLVENADFLLAYDLEDTIPLKSNSGIFTPFKIVENARNLINIEFQLYKWFIFISESNDLIIDSSLLVLDNDDNIFLGPESELESMNHLKQKIKNNIQNSIIISNQIKASDKSN